MSLQVTMQGSLWGPQVPGFPACINVLAKSAIYFQISVLNLKCPIDPWVFLFFNTVIVNNHYPDLRCLLDAWRGGVCSKGKGKTQPPPQIPACHPFKGYLSKVLAGYSVTPFTCASAVGERDQRERRWWGCTDGRSLERSWGKYKEKHRLRGAWSCNQKKKVLSHNSCGIEENRTFC